MCNLEYSRLDDGSFLRIAGFHMLRTEGCWYVLDVVVVEAKGL
jgi:hypothetical protein